jgi:3-oxoadipate enol-lactonase
VFYTSGNAELFYTTLGSGSDVVLLHPTPVHHGFWLPVAEQLASRYRVILPDLRGHGQSAPDAGIIGVDTLGADLERLLDVLGIGKALFAGCSLGAYSLYELWRRAPRRVAGLAFCCGKPQPDTAANRARRDEWIAEISQHGPSGFFEAMAGTLIGPTAHTRKPGMEAEARTMMQPMTGETVIAVQRGLATRPDSMRTAATITVPAFVLAGGEDQSSTPDEMKALAETIRNAGYSSEYHLLPDAGHYAPWEQPETVGPLLARFFRSVNG